MPSKHLVTPAKREQAIKETQDNDSIETDAVRRMYITPDEALHQTVKHHLHWGDTFCEVTEIDLEEGRVELTELFTDRVFEINCPAAPRLKFPYVGEEHTIEWVEALVDGDWERVSEYETPDNPIGLSNKHSDRYDHTRRVSKTYTHGLDEYDAWAIRVDRQTGTPEAPFNHEDTTNPEIYDAMQSGIVLPDEMDLGGIEIGTLYTQSKIVEDDDTGERTKNYEIVWWSIKPQFKSTSGLAPNPRASPVSLLDKHPVDR